MKAMHLQTFCILCVLISSCTQSEKITPKSPEQVFKQVADSVFAARAQQNPKPIAYVIIPNTGCGGCISSVELLFVDLVKKKVPIRFILTNIRSMKSLRKTFGDSIVLSNNVYADQGNLIYSKVPQFTEIYPIIAYIDTRGIVFKYENVSPETPNALDHFKFYLDSVQKMSPQSRASILKPSFGQVNSSPRKKWNSITKT